MSRSTREIERDVERTRSDIEDTVAALREKMSLGQIVDEATHYLRDSGGNEALSNLAAQARANPMPLALVGIGLAWLMSGRGQPAIGSSTGSWAGTGSSVRGFGARAGETAGSAKDALADSGRKAGEAVSSRMHQASDAASQTYNRISDTASHTYGRVSDRAGQAHRSMSQLVESEPLILAGLGLAIGAAIGAMLPASETERRLLGEKLDEMKEGASEIARQEWEKTKSVASDAASAAKSEIEKGGSPAETADRAARSATRTAEQSASDKGLGSSVRKS